MSLHVPANPVRFVTAASLFDGHDAAINVMRRLLQAQGAEVVHLGHDRSVEDVVTAAVQEDAQGVAVSSYQGGHIEYFGYLVERLAERGAAHVRVYGGGGGTIVPAEIAALRAGGVRIFSPADGQRLGLPGMINELIRECDVDLSRRPVDVAALLAGDETALAQAITVLQAGADPALAAAVGEAAGRRSVPVLGIAGTGGSGKSSLTDEFVRRLRRDCEDKLRVAVIAIDPTRRRGNGALLGDRIRMNSIAPGVVYFRSLATRRQDGTVPAHLADVIAACKAAGNDLVIVETPGIGQGDAAITSYSAVSLYVMTPDFGAASQLEKIDMLDLADAVAINKFERRGGEDARRDVARQLVRNREQFGTPWQDMPVFGTSAARFADDGVTALYHHVKELLYAYGMKGFDGVLPWVAGRVSTGLTSALPRGRERYLSEVADAVRGYHATTAAQAALARRRQHLATTRDLLPADAAVARLLAATEQELSGEVRELLEGWPATREAYRGNELVYRVRDADIRTPLTRTTLSGSVLPRVALPRDADDGELVRFLRRVPHQPAVPPAQRGPAGDPAVHGLRLGDPLRARSRCATRHLRQGRHLRRVDRDPGRHAGAVRGFRPVRPEDLGFHDDQRAGAGHPRHVPQRRDRPAGRGVRRRALAG
jgi:methylmalonyl-CoA mutase